MNNKIIALIAIIVVVVLGWFIYTHTNNSAPTVNTSAPVVDTNPPAASTSAAATTTTASTEKDFTVTGSNFSFSPSTLSVNEGDTVKITFTNAGGNHNFVLDEFNVATPVISTGQSATVTFVADKTGSFQYYCSVGNHRAMGMWGTLTVN